MVHHVVLPAVLALWATVSNVHAITITEQAGSGYDLCTNAQLASFSTAIRTESDECAAKVTYNWNSDFLPSTAQRRELCTCKSLISKLQTVKVPYCGFYRITPETIRTGYYSYKDLVKYAFDLCSATSSSGSTTSTTTTTTTTTSRPTANTTPTSPSGGNSAPTFASYTFAPVATYAPYTSSPSFDFGASTSSSKKKSKSSTGVIVGVIIALVAVAAVIAFVIYKRKQKNQETGRKSLSLSSVDGGDLEAGAVGVEAPGDLSPLGGGEGEYASYTSMPPSPSAPDAKHMAL